MQPTYDSYYGNQLKKINNMPTNASPINPFPSMGEVETSHRKQQLTGSIQLPLASVSEEAEIRASGNF